MVNNRPRLTTSSFTFRISPGEKGAAEALAAKRAEEAAAAGFSPDPSVGAWLRWLIREQANAAGISVIEPERSDAPKRSPKRSPKRGAR